jgi:hypothetical protein
MGFVGFQPLQLLEVRARFRKMDDADLLRFGCAVASLCGPGNQFGRPQRQVLMDPLEEGRAEWRRRHPGERPNEGPSKRVPTKAQTGHVVFDLRLSAVN